MAPPASELDAPTFLRGTIDLLLKGAAPAAGPRHVARKPRKRT
jgi:hypothetical protein